MALAPFFCVTTCQMARNHNCNGRLLSPKIVPAVTEVWRPQSRQAHNPRAVRQAFAPPHPGQRKPSGQRKLSEILGASLIRRKPALQFHQRARIIFGHEAQPLLVGVT